MNYVLNNEQCLYHTLEYNINWMPDDCINQHWILSRLETLARSFVEEFCYKVNANRIEPKNHSGYKYKYSREIHLNLFSIFKHRLQTVKSIRNGITIVLYRHTLYSISMMVLHTNRAIEFTGKCVNTMHTHTHTRQHYAALAILYTMYMYILQWNVCYLHLSNYIAVVYTFANGSP